MAWHEQALGYDGRGEPSESVAVPADYIKRGSVRFIPRKVQKCMLSSSIR